MKLTAISIDDEPRAHTVIEHHASKIQDLELVYKFTSPLKALDYLRDHEIDLMFLDINMPDMDGISLLKSLRNPPAVIFTTAYDEYAVESYDHEAAGYLLKPIEFPKFYKAVMRVIDMKRGASSVTKETDDKPASLLLKSGTKMLRFEPGDIRYIEASGNYAELHMEEGKQLVDHTLSELMDEHLPPSFLRIHRSYVINTEYLKEYESHQLKVGEATLPIGKTYRESVRDFVKSLG
ncbi:LytR/AlgR family response regulator transcription factor [Balneola sp. MJW-20]|uniref:LytR/AlgR family response regulator transcription factor n=1 Tax=Gracilimonas aurantiaca TaxID=3234185 RepID=UPI00346518E6